MISAVLDTNTLASGTISALTPPGQIINYWREGKYNLVTSDHIMNELYRTLQKPYFQKHLSLSEVHGFIDLLKNEATITPIRVNLQGITTHPDDDQVVATAVSANVDYLVTGDGPFHRKVGSVYEGITLVTPGEFLSILQQQS